MSSNLSQFCNNTMSKAQLGYHHTSLVRQSLHKYKCLWSVRDKGQGSSHQEKVSYTYILRMCLFGGETEWMKNFREKMRRKTFLNVFGQAGRKENNWWGLGIFSLNTQKSFLSKMERKLKRENEAVMDKNTHVQFFFFFSQTLSYIYIYIYIFFFFFQVVGVIVVLFFV